MFLQAGLQKEQNRKGLFESASAVNTEICGKRKEHFFFNCFTVC